MFRPSYLLVFVLCLTSWTTIYTAENNNDQVKSQGFLSKAVDDFELDYRLSDDVDPTGDDDEEFDNELESPLASENIEDYYENYREKIKSEPKRNELNFLVLGDFGLVNRRQPKASTKELGDFIFNKVKRTFVNYDFIVSVGDILYEYGVQSILDPKVKVLLEDTFKINELGLPWYNTLGNHDCMGNMPATFELANKYPLWHQSRPYYTKIHNIGDSHLKTGFLIPNGCDLVCIVKNNSECYRATHKNVNFTDIHNQLNWIEEELWKMSQDKDIIWKVVVLHNALFSAGKKHGDNEQLIKHLLPLFVKFNVDMVLSGHDHSVQYLRMDKTEYLNHKKGPVGHYFKKGPAAPKVDKCVTQEYFHHELTPTGIVKKDGQYNFLQKLISGKDNNRLDSMKLDNVNLSRETLSDQGKYLHQFVIGNGGKKPEAFCPFEHKGSVANLRYGNGVVGIGDVRIREDKIEVNLLSTKNELLYTARIYRN